jgi:hypothetical protein
MVATHQLVLTGFVRLVLEGLSDGSQVIYCLVSVQKGNRPVGYGMIGLIDATIRAINQPWVKITPFPTGRILD